MNMKMTSMFIVIMMTTAAYGQPATNSSPSTGGTSTTGLPPTYVSNNNGSVDSEWSYNQISGVTDLQSIANSGGTVTSSIGNISISGPSAQAYFEQMTSPVSDVVIPQQGMAAAEEIKHGQGYLCIKATTIQGDSYSCNFHISDVRTGTL